MKKAKKRSFRNEAKDVEPSYAEKKVIDYLKDRKIRYFREVIFPTCVNPETKAPLRYDFYLPRYDLIVEYDGVKYHSAPDVKKRDKIKDEYAKVNGINIVRISGMEDLDKKIGRAIHFGIKDTKKRTKVLAKAELKTPAIISAEARKKAALSKSPGWKKLPAKDKNAILNWELRRK